jgi:hypothetical protein
VIKKMYYAKDKFTLQGFVKSAQKGKMYSALLLNKETKKIIKVSFGDSKMENYSDLTGLNLYPKLIHGDKKRQKSFQARSKGFLKDGYFSPAFFSYYYLWA